MYWHVLVYNDLYQMVQGGTRWYKVVQGCMRSLVAGSAAGAADAAGGAGAGSVFGQGCSLGDEVAPEDQGLGHGTSPAT